MEKDNHFNTLLLEKLLHSLFDDGSFILVQLPRSSTKYVEAHIVLRNHGLDWSKFQTKRPTKAKNIGKRLRNARPIVDNEVIRIDGGKNGVPSWTLLTARSHIFRFLRAAGLTTEAAKPHRLRGNADDDDETEEEETELEYITEFDKNDDVLAEDIKKIWK